MNRGVSPPPSTVPAIIAPPSPPPANPGPVSPPPADQLPPSQPPADHEPLSPSLADHGPLSPPPADESDPESEGPVAPVWLAGRWRVTMVPETTDDDSDADEEMRPPKRPASMRTAMARRQKAAAKHQIKPPCSCAMQCRAKFSQERRVAIRQQYWKLAESQGNQWVFE